VRGFLLVLPEWIITLITSGPPVSEGFFGVNSVALRIKAY
jgi:hypothetical protein